MPALVRWYRLSIGWYCTHRRMRYCCNYRCGHLICPDCKLAWDEGAEK